MRRWLIRLTATAVLLSFTWQSPAAEVTLDSHVESLPEDGRWLLQDAEGGERSAPLRTALSVEEGARVTCQGTGIWCPTLEVRTNPLQVPVFPAIEMTAQLDSPQQILPIEGSVQGVVRMPGDPPVEFRSKVVIDDGRLTLPLPRAPLDLRFAFAGFAPVYRWGIEPAGDDDPLPRLDLGDLLLQPGSSLSGWVRRWEDRIPISQATVTATRGTGQDEAQRLSFRAIEERTGTQGFFQIHGLEPGIWKLVAEAEGLAAEVVEEVEVIEGSETRVGTLLLSPPLQVAVRADPPTHPVGAPWQLEVAPVVPLENEGRHRLELDHEGRGLLTSLRPTEYRVKIQDQRGGNLLVERRVVQSDDAWHLDIPLARVVGQVRLGGEPLVAEVKLEGGSGDRLRLATDDEGRFRGWMRRPERPWLMATVRWSEGDQQRSRLLEVVPQEDEDNGTIEVQLDLPFGAVHGTVVDSAGRTRSGIRVTARSPDRSSRHTTLNTRTDDDGRFHFTGLDASRLELQAGGRGGATSEVVEVDLTDGLPPADVRLELGTTRPLQVRVSHGGRPVAGATVGLVTTGRTPVSLEYRTGGQGEFETRIPSDTTRAVVQVMAPQHALWAGCVSVGDEPLHLALPETPPGTLDLTLTGRGDLPPLLGGRPVLITSEGGFLEVGQLQNWARRRGGSQVRRGDGPDAEVILQIPAIAAGTYAVTWSGVPDGHLADQACAGFSGTPGDGRRWTTVAPGSNGELRYDSSAQQRHRLEELRKAGR